MTFREWIAPHYAAATAYRNALHTVYTTGRAYCEGCDVQDKHISMLIECLYAIPKPPVMGKYPGEVTEEDKEWYRGEGIINNNSTLTDYINRVKQLKTWK